MIATGGDRRHAVTLVTRPDSELIDGLCRADDDALGVLLRRYARLVHRVAADILRDTGEAEDVTQEVFLEIYRKAHLYDPARGSVKVWLLRYAYRRSVRRKDVLCRRPGYRAEPLEGVEGRAHDRRGLSWQERRWLLRAGLAQLPPRQRMTLELAYVEELSLRDIAARLRVSVGCARHYYYRGLARLRVWANRSNAGPPRATRSRGPGS